MRTSLLLVAAGAVVLGAFSASGAEFLEQSERVKGRSYHEAVVTEGGRIVWLAGHTTTTDLNGTDIRGDFEAQARTVFTLLDQTLKRAGGGLNDIVSMTVYLTDARNGPTFAKVRTEAFPDKNFPASAQITVSQLAVPGMQIEVQAIAVIGDKCSKSAPCIPQH
jgi:2-iminobutanoate/2-iminopropanoate deaminase